MGELHSFQEGTEGDHSLPTEYKGVIYMGEGGRGYWENHMVFRG